MDLASPANATIPVCVISGFLGAGKTTLLNALLRRPELSDTVVVVNEFGDVGIDAALIEAAIDDVVLLASGCICCSIRGDLHDTLVTLLSRRESGQLPPFAHVVVETSGVSDPGPILHLLAEDPVLSSRYAPAGCAVVVDVLSIESQLAGFEEAARQVALADIVVLSKTDLADEQAIAGARRAVGAVNPLAGQISRAELVAQSELLLTRQSGVAGIVPLPQPIDHQFSFETLLHGEPIVWERLASWLGSLLSLRGSRILRLKGLVDVAGIEPPVVLHCAMDRVYPPVMLADWPGGERTTRLVLITAGPRLPGLQQAFDTAVRRN